MRRFLITCFSVLIMVSLVLSILSYLNREWGTLTASISLTIAVISGWIAYEAFYRQALMSKPQIIIRVDFRSRYGLVLLVVENKGTRPAFNIRLKWNRELKNSRGDKVTFLKSNSEVEISVLNPGESTSTIIGTPSSLFEKSENKNLDYDGAIIFQESLSSKRITSYPFQFSLEHYRKSPMDETEEPKTMYELQKLPDVLNSIKDELNNIHKTLKDQILNSKINKP